MTATELGQAGLAILVAAIGYMLNRKTSQIHVLVNQRMTDALNRIELLEKKLGLKPGDPIPSPPSEGVK